MSPAAQRGVGRPPARAPEVETRIRTARAAGASYRAIAGALNADAIPTAHGGATWHPTTVARILNRLTKENSP